MRPEGREPKCGNHLIPNFRNKGIARRHILLSQLYSTEQIIGILKAAEAAGSIRSACTEHNITEQTFYRWRLMSEVLRAFLRAVFADQRRRARHHHGVSGGHCGAVTALQRFGSALNLAPHAHSLVLDGVYPGPAHSPGPFLPLPPPTTEDVARVMAGTARRVMRLLEKRGLDSGDDPLAVDDPLLATLMPRPFAPASPRGPKLVSRGVGSAIVSSRSSRERAAPRPWRQRRRAVFARAA